MTTQNRKKSCKHCRWMRHKNIMSTECTEVHSDMCYIAVSSRLNKKNITLQKVYTYALSLIKKEHDSSYNISDLFHDTTVVCFQLIKLGFIAPRILVNVTAEHHHSWICLDQTTHDCNLFDSMFGTRNGVYIPSNHISGIKKIQLEMRPYKTDYVQITTIDKFSDITVPNQSYYVFCDFVRNKVMVATENK